MKHEHRPKKSSISDELFEYRSTEKKRLILSIVITGVVMIIEVIGGILTNSIALISDAGHMFTHFFALAISLGAILAADRDPCHHRTFGFYRIEILAALFNSIFLFGVTAWIVGESVRRILYPARVLGGDMLLVAIIGLAANLASAVILHGASKEDLNVKSAFLHMAADTLSSVVIIIGAIVILFTGWNSVDPILSIGISVLIFAWGWSLLKDSVNILLESAPKGITAEMVSKSVLEAVPQIAEITDLHIWTITSGMYSMTAHLTLSKESDSATVRQIISKVKKTVDEQFDIEHVTIEID